MPKIVLEAETTASPEQVLAAAADCTERRPEIWPNVSRRYYKVHERGDTWAEVTEGSEVMGAGALRLELARRRHRDRPRLERLQRRHVDAAGGAERKRRQPHPDRQ